MNRRQFLAATGLVGSLGLVGAGRGSGERGLSAVVWFSERAAGYDGVESRATGYLGAALRAVRDDVQVDVGDRPIPLDEEDGTRLMEVEWPKMVLSGVAGRGPVDRTGDLNLLVTDGDPSASPAGYGMRGIATVCGARPLASMPPAERTPPVVPYSAPAVITQLLLHECGHALGLEHAHGRLTNEGNAAVVSPMVGGYAWADEDLRRRQLPDDANVCGEPIGGVVNRRPLLGLEYGPCARAALERFRPGVLP